jgi:hypothetical protein
MTTAPLTGDARRWRLIDLRKFQRQREILEYELYQLNCRIYEAKKHRDQFRRRLDLSYLMPRFVAVRSDWEMARAGEVSAKRDLGEL